MHTRIAMRVLSMLLWLAIGTAASEPARAEALLGDLNGDGALNYIDEILLAGFYGSVQGDPNYTSGADANSDGAVDLVDLALFGASFGSNGGDVDTTPPGLFVTFSDIPDDMNDLLVVPPGGFELTIDFAELGGAVINPETFSAVSDHAVGLVPAGYELSPLFSVSQSRATFKVPAGSNLERTSHYLTVTVGDYAGNTNQVVYGFGVRDFPVSGAPLGPLQTVFLDFGQDRSLTSEIDFIEDLRTFHLTSSAAPAYETQVRDWVVMEILARANQLFGRNADGSPGPDAVNLMYVDTLPAGTHSRLCVGGSSQLGALYLGATQLDVNNINDAQDECNIGSIFGVFPQALDNLWGSDPTFLAAFGPLDPAMGGTPIGEHILDPIVLAAGFNPAAGTPNEQVRWDKISDAVDAFAQAIATATVHETGHLVGLVAHNPAPAGLFGGNAGADFDHNVTPGGTTPGTAFLMNQGGSFTFATLTGRDGEPLPGFRRLSWAYLQDEIVLNSAVTALYPAPTALSVTPSVVDLSGGGVVITVSGTGFVATPKLELVEPQDPTPNEVLGETLQTSGSMTGVLNGLLVQPALYDVELTNPDGQKVVLEEALLVQ